MNTIHLENKFEMLGARAHVRRETTPGYSVVINIRKDDLGEYFDIAADAKADISVLDVQPKDRHLLLMVRRPAERRGVLHAKDKFLCGHDERHWFVAAIPELAPVSSVVTAKEALKPELVRHLEQGQRGKHENRQRRKTDAYVRQGEWFFVPAPEVQVNDRHILRNEPISRGRGKPHMCEFLHRIGGTAVYVCAQYPEGLNAKQHRKLLQRDPAAENWNWRPMRRNPVVYVRGKISHPDHATIRLIDWHRVLMNTENQSRAMQWVAFLD